MFWYAVLLALLGGGNIPIAESSRARGAMRHDVAAERYLALGAAPQFASVGLIRHRQEDARASAILVATQWVLTAGHAVHGTEPAELMVLLDTKAYSVVRVVMHPEYRERTIGNGVDLALLQLAEPVSRITPAERYRGYAERGQVGTAVGFGVAGTGRNALLDPMPSGTKRAGTNMIDAIGGRIDGLNAPPNLMVADFDRPNDPSFNRTGSAVPLEMEYMPLGGDSGGGLFIEQDGGFMLAGVFSGYSFRVQRAVEIGMYGSLMFWTRLSMYNGWVDETTGTRAPRAQQAALVGR